MRGFVRSIPWILLGLFILCVAGAVVSAIDNRSIFPPVPEETDRLDVTEVAQIEEAMQLRRVVADKVWPGFGSAYFPLMVGNDAGVFLVDADQILPGWQLVEGQKVAGEPVYYKPLSEMGGKLQAFVTLYGNTWVPSWYTYRSGSSDILEWASSSIPYPFRLVVPYRLVLRFFMPEDVYETGWIHESFHAYQAQVTPQKFNAVQADYAIASNYPVLNSVFNDAWAKEIDLLVRAAQANTDAQAKALAREFLAARASRRDVTPIAPKLVQFEKDAEWLEGLAKYVELATGKAAGLDDSYVVTKGAELSDYKSMVSRSKQQLSQARGLDAAPDDDRFYYTGLDQAVLLDRLMPNWKSRILTEDVWLEDLLAEAVK